MIIHISSIILLLFWTYNKTSRNADTGHQKV